MPEELTNEQIRELEVLMKEYPDWKEQFPEIYQQLQQPRFHKNRKSLSHPNGRVIPKRSVTVPLSDYQQTFRGSTQARPRSSKRPPPTPRDPRPSLMTFVTNQRADFVPKDLRVRPSLIINKENHEMSTAPFDGTSTYQKEFRSLQVHPEVRKYPALTDGQLKRPSGRFDSQTTNKEHFKQWVPQAAFTFSELPSFTGSLLYPEPPLALESTTRATFQGATGPKADLIRHSYGHIKLEGDHDHDTTTRTTYKSFDGARAAERVVHKPQLPVRKRDRFVAETQAMHDFGRYQKGQPSPPRPITPPPETIQLKFDNKVHFQTEQQSEYLGVDVASHPPPRAMVPDVHPYEPPTTKFETETHQKRDFKPIALQHAYIAPVRMPEARVDTLPKFNAETSNKFFFKKWDVGPRKRYVDFHEGHKYIPPQEVFDGKSTTRETFKGEKTAVRPPFKPAQHAMAGEGRIDFDTMYKTTFSEPSMVKVLSKDKANRVLNDLRRRKRQESRFAEQQVTFAKDIEAK